MEAITTPFAIHPGVAIPPGRYDWHQHLFALESDHSRALSASARFMLGDFWSGRQRTMQASMLYRPNYRMVFDLGLQVSDIDLDSPAELVRQHARQPALRAIHSARTCFSTALMQYRTDVKQFSANVRFNLIHRPLSDFFIVYNESQFTDTAQTAGRGLVVKYTQMFSF